MQGNELWLKEANAFFLLCNQCLPLYVAAVGSVFIVFKYDMAQAARQHADVLRYTLKLVREGGYSPYNGEKKIFL